MLLLKLSRFIKDFCYYHRFTVIPFASYYPSIYQIETTNTCNIRCIMCPWPGMARKKGHMNFDLFQNIIHQAKGNRNRLIILHHFGEPLLHPEIVRFINYAEKFMDTLISTNAVNLTKEKAKEILRSELSYITISINGVDEHTYFEVTQKKYFDKVVSNVISFLQLRQQYGNTKLQVNLQMIKMNNTRQQIDDFTEFWKNQGAEQIHIKNFDTWAGQIEPMKKLARPDDHFRSSNDRRYPCKYLWDNIVILWDGRVVPCCRDYDGKEILGDLNKQSLGEVWRGDQLYKLRAHHIAGNFSVSELCKDCVEWIGYPKRRFYPLDFLFQRYQTFNKDRTIRTIS